MKIAICDDSASDAKQLRNICLETALFESSVIDIFEDGGTLLEAYLKNRAEYDVLFLDIDMPSINGITLAKRIKKICPAAVLIFTTSYPQYAIEAFDCEAFHYLLKPCDRDKVFDVLNRAITKYNLLHQYHIVKCRNQTYRVPIKDIYYIECCRKHLIYHLKDRTLETVAKLSAAYESLSDFGFYQVHQGYIVNFDKVYDFKDYTIVLDDNRTVMMSVRKKKEVLLAYAKYAERFI